MTWSPPKAYLLLGEEKDIGVDSQRQHLREGQIGLVFGGTWEELLLVRFWRTFGTRPKGGSPKGPLAEARAYPTHPTFFLGRHLFFVSF